MKPRIIDVSTEILERHGYKKHGNSYYKDYSESGMKETVEFTDNGVFKEFIVFPSIRVLFHRKIKMMIDEDIFDEVSDMIIEEESH